MAFFRVAKKNDYTVISNFHLKDKSLSLKAKGLLTVMLSLPDEWNFTTRGLTVILKEGMDCISATLKELENAGYILRSRLRDEKGRITDTEYLIFESPQKVEPDKAHQDTARPYTENPDMDSPNPGVPCRENPAQLNTNVSKTYESKTQKSNPNQSKRASAAPDGWDEMDSVASESDIRRLRSKVREQIDYDALVEPHNRQQLDEIVEIMVEVLASHAPTISISSEKHPTWLVQERMRKINAHHIEYIFGCLRKKRTEVHNIKKYLLATLFNAPVTMENYYDSEVRHAGLI